MQVSLMKSVTRDVNEAPFAPPLLILATASDVKGTQPTQSSESQRLSSYHVRNRGIRLLSHSLCTAKPILLLHSVKFYLPQTP